MTPIPLIVLGGSDRRAANLPEGTNDDDQHPLVGYKGLELHVDGRPIVEVVIERMAATGTFGPIWVVGPERLYRPVLPDVRIVDSDLSFGENIRAAVETARRELQSEYVAVTTCDLVPEPAEMEVVAADIARHLPFDYWMPHVPVDAERLGQSDWKPRYLMRPPGAPEALGTLPGHLVIAAVEGVRLDFVYALFDALYSTRNSSVPRRVVGSLRAMFLHMLGEDVRLLLSGRLPYVLFTIIGAGFKVGRLLVRGDATTPELEDLIRKISMSREHRRLFPQRRGRIAVLDVLSLARDIDTEEEARELTDAGRLGGAESADS